MPDATVLDRLPQVMDLLAMVALFLAVAVMEKAALEKYLTMFWSFPVSVAVVVLPSDIVAEIVGLLAASFTEAVNVVVLVPISVAPL